MELLRINYESEQPTMSARELHEGLEIKTAFKDWFPRMAAYGFEENQDFILAVKKRATNNPKNPTTTYSDYQISIDMAKQICMIQRTDKDKQYRQYFINLEKAWNTPEQVMARALKIAKERNEQCLISTSLQYLKIACTTMYYEGIHKYYIFQFDSAYTLLADTNRAILYRAESFADMINCIERMETCRKEVQA